MKREFEGLDHGAKHMVKVADAIDEFVIDMIRESECDVWDEKHYNWNKLDTLSSTRRLLLENIYISYLYDSEGLQVSAKFILLKIIDACNKSSLKDAMKVFVYSMFSGIEFYGCSNDKIIDDEDRPTVLVNEAYVHWMGYCALGHAQYFDIVDERDSMPEFLLKCASKNFFEVTGLTPVT